jgi:polygalacturonase
MFTRRSFCGVAGGALSAAAGVEDDWQEARKIASRVRPLFFPERDFNVVEFGADRRGKKDSTKAFRRAIEACSLKGGGRVAVPEGVYLTGAIRLLSNVNLHVGAGATLRFSTDPRDYLPVVRTRWEGIECLGYSALIYAFESENVAVTGEGVLDGQADERHWWPWKGQSRYGWKEGEPNQQKARDRLNKLGEQGAPLAQRLFAEESYLRPQFIETYRCNDVSIEGVTVRNSPMWVIHPVLGDNIAVIRVKVTSHGPNNDGCDPDSCSDVLIKDCYFDTGDDCIAIKSGRNEDGRRVAAACRNVVIEGCQMKDGHGGVVIGSEVSGGVRNVFAANCQMDSPHLERVLRIKTNATRGGVIENVYLRNIQVGQVADAAIVVDFHYEEGEKGTHMPVVRNIDVRDLVCRSAKRALDLRGFPTVPIRDVHLERCRFENVRESDLVENVSNLTRTDVTVNGRTVSERP